jgi:hypothetical protein
MNGLWCKLQPIFVLHSSDFPPEAHWFVLAPNALRWSNKLYSFRTSRSECLPEPPVPCRYSRFEPSAAFFPNQQI